MRFPEYTDEWDTIKIKDKFNFLRTNSFSRDKLIDTQGTVKNIHYGDIHMTYPTIVDVEQEQIPFINSFKVQIKDLNKYDFCKNGDLLIADASEDYEDIGKTIELIHITNSKVIGGLHTILLRDKTNNNALGFNGYYFQTKYFKKQIKIIANGVSVLGINKKDLKELTIKTPFKKEQENIASFLFNIDKKLKLLKNKKVGFIEFKHYLLQNLFPRNDELTPKLRFKMYIKDISLMYKIFDFENLINEKTLKSEKNNQYPILSSTKEGIYSQKDYFNRQIASSKNIGYKILQRNQLVFSPQNLWMGNININDKYDIGLVSPSYKVYDINKNIILPSYLKYIIKLPRLLHEFKISSSQGASTVRRNLNLKLFNKIKIRIPSLEEQEKIASFLSVVDKKIDLLNQEIEYVEEYKKGLLQKMFIWRVYLFYCCILSSEYLEIMFYIMIFFLRYVLLTLVSDLMSHIF